MVLFFLQVFLSFIYLQVTYFLTSCLLPINNYCRGLTFVRFIDIYPPYQLFDHLVMVPEDKSLFYSWAIYVFLYLLGLFVRFSFSVYVFSYIM